MGTIATTGAISQRFAGLWPRPAVRLRLYQVVFAVCVFGFWQYASGRLIDSFWVSSPTAVAAFLWDGFSSGYLVSHCLVTFGEAGLGFAIGAAAGLLTGLILAVAETPRRILDPYFMAIYGMPRIALAPLFIIWFGIGEPSKIVLASMLSFFLCFYATLSGLRSVDPALISIARVMGATERQVFLKVVLPAASPWIITAMKVSVPFALVGAIVGEFMAATAGLGFKIQLYTAQFDTNGAVTGIFVLMLVVIAFNTGLNRLEAHVLRWRPAAEPGRGSEMQ